MRYLGGQRLKAVQILNCYRQGYLKWNLHLKHGFYDVFSGAGSISKVFAPYAKVQASDSASFAVALSAYEAGAHKEDNECIIIFNQEVWRVTLFDDFSLWFIQQFAHQIPYFSQENAQRIMAYRQLILSLSNERQQQVLWGALFNEILDKANIRLLFDGPFKPHCENQAKIVLRPATILGQDRIRTYQMNALEVLPTIQQGVVYLNPPSFAKDYVHYYHILQVIMDGVSGEVVDKAGRYEAFKAQYPAGNWTKSRNARAALYELLNNTHSEVIMLSYNKRGVLPIEEVEKALLLKGNKSTFRTYDLGNEMLYIVENDNEIMY